MRPHRLPKAPDPAPRLPALPPETQVLGARERAEIVARSAVFRAALRMMEEYAPLRVPVLLIGEPGTGKTACAQYVHEISPRRSSRMSVCNLGAMPKTLVVSELFGYVAGAFTGADETRRGAFQAASGSSLFFDELGQATKESQRLFLTAIESSTVQPLGTDRAVPVDVRLIFATNRSLSDLVAGGNIFADLAARLEHWVINLPPLRERREDLPELIERCIARRAREIGYERAPTLERDLKALLCAYRWPGNLRELDNQIQRILVHGRGAAVLGTQHVPADIACKLAETGGLSSEPLESKVRREFMECRDVMRVARENGISRPTAYRLIGDELLARVRRNQKDRGDGTWRPPSIDDESPPAM